MPGKRFFHLWTVLVLAALPVKPAAAADTAGAAVTDVILARGQSNYLKARVVSVSPGRLQFREPGNEFSQSIDTSAIDLVLYHHPRVETLRLKHNLVLTANFSHADEDYIYLTNSSARNFLDSLPNEQDRYSRFISGLDSYASRIELRPRGIIKFIIARSDLKQHYIASLFGIGGGPGYYIHLDSLQNNLSNGLTMNLFFGPRKTLYNAPWGHLHLSGRLSLGSFTDQTNSQKSFSLATAEAVVLFSPILSLQHRGGLFMGIGPGWLESDNGNTSQMNFSIANSIGLSWEFFPVSNLSLLGQSGIGLIYQEGLSDNKSGWFAVISAVYYL